MSIPIVDTLEGRNRPTELADDECQRVVVVTPHIQSYVAYLANRAGDNREATSVQCELHSPGPGTRDCAEDASYSPQFQRPWHIQTWIDYVVPFRQILDCVLLLANPQFWAAATHNFQSYPHPVHIMDTITSEQHLIQNYKVWATVGMVIFSILIPNLVESGMLAYYRNNFSLRWKILLIHHLMLLGFLSLCLVYGKGIICVQALTGLTHLFALPTTVWRRWKHWESKARIAAVVTWVVSGYFAMSVMHIYFLALLIASAERQHVMGPTQYAYYVCALGFLYFNLDMICMALGVLQKHNRHLTCLRSSQTKVDAVDSHPRSDLEKLQALP